MNNEGRKVNVLLDKSKLFAIRIIKLYRFLRNEKKEDIIGKQLFRSGTSIGANIAESHYAASKPDFVNKLHIALKEASETEYWLTLLFESEILSEQESASIILECRELIKLLTASIKTAKAQ